MILATAGLAAAVDFMLILMVLALGFLGLLLGIFGYWKSKRILTGIGITLLLLPIFPLAMGLRYALTVSPEEDQDAAGYAPMWGIALGIIALAVITLFFTRWLILWRQRRITHESRA